MNSPPPWQMGFSVKRLWIRHYGVPVGLNPDITFFQITLVIRHMGTTSPGPDWNRDIGT